MTYEEQFMKDFEAWVSTQVMVNEMAMKEAEAVAQEGDQRAVDAVIRYESRVDAYKYMLGKFENYKDGKEFHHMPDDLFSSKEF